MAKTIVICPTFSFFGGGAGGGQQVNYPDLTGKKPGFDGLRLSTNCACSYLRLKFRKLIFRK